MATAYAAEMAAARAATISGSEEKEVEQAVAGRAAAVWAAAVRAAAVRAAAGGGGGRWRLKCSLYLFYR